MNWKPLKPDGQDLHVSGTLSIERVGNTIHSITYTGDNGESLKIIGTQYDKGVELFELDVPMVKQWTVSYDYIGHTCTTPPFDNESKTRDFERELKLRPEVSNVQVNESEVPA